MSYSMTTPTADQVGVLHNGAIPVLAGYVGANPATSGANHLVPAPPAGVQVVVLSLTLSNNTASAMVVYLVSSSTTSVVTGNINFPATIETYPTMSCGPLGIFASAPGEGVDIHLSASNAIGVTMTYTYFQPAGI
ncbi:MAG TPA: hypothetical protein VKF17_16830 [Isosphaeraceae bacterium]|nr:hypothetical protein [Isosphaeraceae bacterium]